MTTSITADVVVVGAGFAGVAAARDLGRAGFDVALLEARNRIGGRTWTKDSTLGLRLEFGGGFVHWQQPHLWSELVAHGLDVEPVAVPEEAYWVGPEGTVAGEPFEAFALIAEVMNAVSVGAQGDFPRPHSPFPLTPAAEQSDRVGLGDFLDTLNLSAEQHLMARSVLSLAFSGDPGAGALSQVRRLIALSAGRWELFLEAASAYTIKDGTAGLIDAMHDESAAVTYLGANVSTIESTDQGVSVKAVDGRDFRAQKVIVTLPLNVLTSIEFVPPLSPVKVAASKSGQVSKGVKVWMRARGKMRPFIAFAPHPAPLHMVGYEHAVGDDSILLGFGGDAASIDITDVAQVQQAVRTWLPEIELLGVDSHDWTHDPLTGETWAMYGPQQLSTFGEEFQRPDGNVHIAGGDYALGWSGHIDGAIESGRRAARVVAELLAAQRVRT